MTSFLTATSERKIGKETRSKIFIDIMTAAKQFIRRTFVEGVQPQLNIIFVYVRLEVGVFPFVVICSTMSGNTRHSMGRNY